DVIDEGSIRRGKKAARHLWGNRASILAGDFLYASAMAKGLSFKNHDVNDALQRACIRMIEGEMSQHIHHMDPDMLESVYIHIIQNKTASLMEAACSLAGIVSGASAEQREALRNFGLYLGTAFQVADDTLDYTATESRLGKTLGADLKEGKVTLPLIHLLKNGSPEERKMLLRLLGSETVNEIDLEKVLKLMRHHGSLNYALSTAREYVEKAKGYLSPFEPSFEKSALCAVTDYVVTRDH
ncbi:MAG TPA: polyprenyl synthetase family protein, partial [Nitrospiria bacterium]